VEQGMQLLLYQRLRRSALSGFESVVQRPTDRSRIPTVSIHSEKREREKERQKKDRATVSEKDPIYKTEGGQTGVRRNAVYGVLCRCFVVCACLCYLAILVALVCQQKYHATELPAGFQMNRT